MLMGAFTGIAIKTAEPRTSSKGNLWLSLLLKDGNAQDAQLVVCSVFGSFAEALGTVEAGETVYVEGSLSLSTYTDRRTGAEKTGLQLACSRAFRLEIGSRSPRLLPVLALTNVVTAAP